MTPSIIALVPARAGSKRIQRKNVRELNGHPLVAYALATAHESAIFSAVAVSSDDPETLEIAEHYGATHLILRPSELAGDYSPDIAWVNHVMEAVGRTAFDAFCILRPTSPFRRGEWVARAWDAFRHERCDSLRAMRPACEHPGKMWRAGPRCATPILPFHGLDAPWHSMPTQELPRVLVQTAALEIAWTEVLPESISGEIVMPWITGMDDGPSIDLNTEADWRRCVDAATIHPEWLPKIAVEAMA